MNMSGGTHHQTQSHSLTSTPMTQPSLGGVLSFFLPPLFQNCHHFFFIFTLTTSSPSTTSSDTGCRRKHNRRIFPAILVVTDFCPTRMEKADVIDNGHGRCFKRPVNSTASHDNLTYCHTTTGWGSLWGYLTMGVRVVALESY